MSEEHSPKLIGKKKGGPYPKSEQEKRRAKVYERHFEKGYSAIQIAQDLNVNRNTVNADIQFFYTQMAAQIGGRSVDAILLKQIERLENQRRRLLEEIKPETEFKSKIIVEKMIFEIDNKIAGFVSRLEGRNLTIGRYGITEEISEEEIKDTVRYLIFDTDNSPPEHMLENTILENIIRRNKCDFEYARNVLNTMNKLGFGLCSVDTHTGQLYELLKFASMRGYITKVEHKSCNEKIKNKKIEEEKETKEFDRKYEEEHGKNEKMWSEISRDMMKKESDGV